MSTVEMSFEEKNAVCLQIFDLYLSGHEAEAAALARKKIPAEKFMERALGRKYLEDRGYDTSKLDD